GRRRGRRAAMPPLPRPDALGVAEDPLECGLCPAELERKEAEADRDERHAGPRQDEERESADERREPAGRDGRANEKRPPAMSCRPLAQAVERGHATAAPSRSPSFRSR